jgi:23S rRNA pseudouridine2605 synthase
MNAPAPAADTPESTGDDAGIAQAKVDATGSHAEAAVPAPESATDVQSVSPAQSAELHPLQDSQEPQDSPEPDELQEPQSYALEDRAPDRSDLDAPAAQAVPADDAPPGAPAKAGAPRGQASAQPQPIRFEDVVSGRFDEEEQSPEVALPKRVLAPQAETPKLHKVLAQAGLGSRLEMEQLIMEGRISVNNEPAHIGQRIQFGDQIKVNGKPIRFRIAPPPARVIAYHKPVGEVVTHDDPQNRPTVFRKLPRLQQGKWQSVGRLDLNTEGLLLFTSSGELANKLMHPRFGLEREYAVRVLGALSTDEKHRLLDGIELDDGRAQFGSIEEGGGEGANSWYRVTISEGRNREVRRLFESLGHAVSRLIRIRYGAMVLPRGLKRGAYMELDERDIRSLTQAAGLAMPRTEPEADDARGGQNRRRNNNRTGGPRGPGGPAGGQRNGGQPGRNFGPGQGTGQGQPRRGNDRGDRDRDRNGGGGSSQPDPMKTSFGYIGADSFIRQRQGVPGQPRRSGPGGPGGGGGGAGPRRNRGGR